MDQGTGLDIVIILAFVFVIWYIAGAQWQRRVSKRYVRVLGETAQALSRSGAMPRVRWLGQALFQLVVDDAVEPFAKLSIVTLLKPRESVLLWLVAVLRRRGDSITVRADLRSPPRASATRERKGPVGRMSLAPQSPHVIAPLDPGWVRTRTPEEIASAIRQAAAAG